MNKHRTENRAVVFWSATGAWLRIVEPGGHCHLIDLGLVPIGELEDRAQAMGYRNLVVRAKARLTP